MPLIVQCPRGCEIRMSRNRSGKIVRCPKCKCAMRVPRLTEAQLNMGGIIPCRAKIARRRRIDPDEQAKRQEEIIKQIDLELEQENIAKEKQVPVEHDSTPVVIPKLVLPDELSDQEQPISAELKTDEELSSSNTISEQAASFVSEPEDELTNALPTVQPVTDSKSDTASVSTGNEESIGAVAENVEAAKTSGYDKIVSDNVADSISPSLNDADPFVEEPGLETPLPVGVSARKNDETSEQQEPETSDQQEFNIGASVPTPPVGIPMFDLNDPAPAIEQDRNWEQRLSAANTDRKMLARFFALCLAVVAIINMIPAIYHWYHWAQLTDSVPLPRWIYIQIFVGALHLIYAVFLAQIPDWSAMRAVSVALLFMAFIFGIVSTGLLVGGSGNLSGFLGIPFALNRQACFWCVAMLCLATLMSYWGGKESANWQRAEHLLKDILAKPAG